MRTAGNTEWRYPRRPIGYNQISLNRGESDGPFTVDGICRIYRKVEHLARRILRTSNPGTNAIHDDLIGTRV